MLFLKRSSLESFNNELSEFARDFDTRLAHLKKSLKYPSVTSASSYRDCVNDLHSRLELVENVLDDIGGEDSRENSTEYLKNVDRILQEIDAQIERVGDTTYEEKKVLSSYRMPERSSGRLSSMKKDESPDEREVWSPSMQKLVGKYGTGQVGSSPVFVAALKEQDVVLEADEKLAMKYADESLNEDNTLELKSQVIFSRSTSMGGTERPEPIKELDDIGPTPCKAIDDKKLEEAISAALARCEVKGVTPKMPNTISSRISSVLPPSAPRTASTPKLPTSLPPYHPIDSSSYASLPSFIRGQISFEDLDQASLRMHTLVANRNAQGEGITFCSADVDQHANLEPGKSKVFLNALAKLDQIQLKVIYGQGTVYFFV